MGALAAAAAAAAPEVMSRVFGSGGACVVELLWSCALHKLFGAAPPKSCCPFQLFPVVREARHAVGTENSYFDHAEIRIDSLSR